MALSPVDRAERLSNKAVKGFHRAHSKLKQANEMLDAHAEQQRQDYIRWQKEMEQAIAQAQQAEKNAQALKVKNAKKINLLGDLIA